MNKIKPAAESEMNALHETVARVLRERIESGEAKPADIANAIKFLKDNGINCPLDENEDLLSIDETLPTFISQEIM